MQSKFVKQIKEHSGANAENNVNIVGPIKTNPIELAPGRNAIINAFFTLNINLFRRVVTN